MAKENHTDKHPMISPDILNSINYAFLQSSVFRDCMVSDSNIDDLFAKVFNRYGCVRSVPLNSKAGRFILLSRAMVGTLAGSLAHFGDGHGALQFDEFFCQCQ